MKESNKLRQEGKLLWEYDKAKSNELDQYLIFLEDDIVWQSRKEYFQIVDFFINKSITVDEFIEQYGQLRRSNFDALDMCQKNLEAEAFGGLPKTSEIDFQLNPQSRGFTRILSCIENNIDLFDSDIDFDMNLKHPELIVYGISEEFFRLDLKDNLLPRIGEYCKES